MNFHPLFTYVITPKVTPFLSWVNQNLSFLVPRCKKAYPLICLLSFKEDKHLARRQITPTFYSSQEAPLCSVTHLGNPALYRLQFLARSPRTWLLLGTCAFCHAFHQHHRSLNMRSKLTTDSRILQV